MGNCLYLKYIYSRVAFMHLQIMQRNEMKFKQLEGSTSLRNQNMTSCDQYGLLLVFLYAVFALTRTVLSQSSVKVWTRSQASLRPQSLSSSWASLPSTRVCKPALISVRPDSSAFRRSDSFSRPWLSTSSSKYSTRSCYDHHVSIIQRHLSYLS